MGSGLTRRSALAGGSVWLAGCAGGGLYASGRAAPAGRVLIAPAHITLGERRLGGVFHLRRDWSEALRRPVLDAAGLAVARRRRVPVFMGAKSDLDTAWALARLHRPVAESLMGFDAPLTGGAPVTTRDRPGLGVRGRTLAAQHGAPTGLFISITGGYPEGWQRAAEIVIGEMFDETITGVERRIIVSLVALDTGAVLWSGARHDRAIRDPRRAAHHVRALVARANFTAEREA